MNLREKLPDEYIGVIECVELYWRAYGGWTALSRSPYLHVSLLLSLVLYPLWFRPTLSMTPWYDLAISIFPNMMGFTLGGYAILLAFGNEKFLELISGSEENRLSPFMAINGAFLHFIILQGAAILIAMVFKSWDWRSGIGAWLGVTISIYALFSSIAAAMAIFRTASLLDRYRARKNR